MDADRHARAADPRQTAQLVAQLLAAVERSAPSCSIVGEVEEDAFDLLVERQAPEQGERLVAAFFGGEDRVGRVARQCGVHLADGGRRLAQRLEQRLRVPGQPVERPEPSRRGRRR